MANALFVCLHNAGRSQMSQALFERAAEGRHSARSAGTTPGDRVHPEVVEVMHELGIDLSAKQPKALTTEDAKWADVVVTMGCGDKCPYVPGKRYVDWDLPDPKGQPIEAVRATRDEIERRVGTLVAELDADPHATEIADASRRTRLANERTELAWWRTGLTALAVALGIGRVVPELNDSSVRWPYVIAGVGFALWGIAAIAYGTRRSAEVERVLAAGRFPEPPGWARTALAAGGIALGLLTAVLILLD